VKLRSISIVIIGLGFLCCSDLNSAAKTTARETIPPIASILGVRVGVDHIEDLEKRYRDRVLLVWADILMVVELGR